MRTKRENAKYVVWSRGVRKTWDNDSAEGEHISELTQTRFFKTLKGAQKALNEMIGIAAEYFGCGQYGSIDDFKTNYGYFDLDILSGEIYGLECVYKDDSVVICLEEVGNSWFTL